MADDDVLVRAPDRSKPVGGTGDRAPLIVGSAGGDSSRTRSLQRGTTATRSFSLTRDARVLSSADFVIEDMQGSDNNLGDRQQSRAERDIMMTSARTRLEALFSGTPSEMSEAPPTADDVPDSEAASASSALAAALSAAHTPASALDSPSASADNLNQRSTDADYGSAAHQHRGERRGVVSPLGGRQRTGMSGMPPRQEGDKPKIVYAKRENSLSRVAHRVSMRLNRGSSAPLERSLEEQEGVITNNLPSSDKAVSSATAARTPSSAMLSSGFPSESTLPELGKHDSSLKDKMKRAFGRGASKTAGGKPVF